MITFHEGLPRSGKSYESLVYHIIPQLKTGRQVFAYVEGLNHEKIASLCGLTIDKCKELLHQITRDDVYQIYSVVENDSFVVIDELQNFWPSGRQRLDPEITQFVTEHGHRGLDILCMGQSLADCHNLWKRRVEVKMTFLKRSMIGKGDTYKWTAYQGEPNQRGDVQYHKMNSGVKKYEPKYFGSYKSHTDGTSNTGNYENARISVFNNATFKYILPVFAGVLFYAVYFLYGFFTDEPVVVDVVKPVVERSLEVQHSLSRPDERKFTYIKKYDVNPNTDAEHETDFKDYFDTVFTRFHVRLTGVLAYSNGYFLAYLEANDDSYKLKERFTSQDLESIGWDVKLMSFGLVVGKGASSYLVRYQPLDLFGHVSENAGPDLVSDTSSSVPVDSNTL